MPRYVAYYRVSTQKQGAQGLGIEAQQMAVRTYLQGREHVLIEQYIEVESGRNPDRPKLAQAIALCRRHRATLIIARLDRLARSVAFISALMESGVQFVACDLAHATPLTLHILAAVAEAEAKATSQRTRAAMAAAKVRGVTLGNPNLSDVQPLARAAIIKKANERAASLLPTIQQIVRAGCGSVHKVAAELNNRGIRTSRNAVWHGTTVSNLLKRSGYANLQALAGAGG